VPYQPIRACGTYSAIVLAILSPNVVQSKLTLSPSVPGGVVGDDVAGVGVPGGPGGVDELGPDGLGGRADDDGVVREQVGLVE